MARMETGKDRLSVHSVVGGMIAGPEGPCASRPEIRAAMGDPLRDAQSPDFHAGLAMTRGSHGKAPGEKALRRDGHVLTGLAKAIALRAGFHAGMDAKDAADLPEGFAGPEGGLRVRLGAFRNGLRRGSIPHDFGELGAVRLFQGEATQGSFWERRLSPPL